MLIDDLNINGWVVGSSAKSVMLRTSDCSFSFGGVDFHLSILAGDVHFYWD